MLHVLREFWLKADSASQCNHMFRGGLPREQFYVYFGLAMSMAMGSSARLERWHGSLAGPPQSETCNGHLNTTLICAQAASSSRPDTRCHRHVRSMTGLRGGLCGFVDDALDFAAVDAEFAGYGALAAARMCARLVPSAPPLVHPLARVVRRAPPIGAGWRS